MQPPFVKFQCAIAPDDTEDYGTSMSQIAAEIAEDVVNVKRFVEGRSPEIKSCSGQTITIVKNPKGGQPIWYVPKQVHIRYLLYVVRKRNNPLAHKRLDHFVETGVRSGLNVDRLTASIAAHQAQRPIVEIKKLRTKIKRKADVNPVPDEFHLRQMYRLTSVEIEVFSELSAIHDLLFQIRHLNNRDADRYQSRKQNLEHKVDVHGDNIANIIKNAFEKIGSPLAEYDFDRHSISFLLPSKTLTRKPRNQTA